MLWLIKIIINLLTWLYHREPGNPNQDDDDGTVGWIDDIDQYLAYLTSSNGDDQC